METQARSKLRAWMHRPRGSLGLIVAIFALLAVVAAFVVDLPALEKLSGLRRSAGGYSSNIP